MRTADLNMRTHPRPRRSIKKASNVATVDFTQQQPCAQTTRAGEVQPKCSRPPRAPGQATFPWLVEYTVNIAAQPGACSCAVNRARVSFAAGENCGSDTTIRLGPLGLSGCAYDAGCAVVSLPLRALAAPNSPRACCACLWLFALSTSHTHARTHAHALRPRATSLCCPRTARRRAPCCARSAARRRPTRSPSTSCGASTAARRRRRTAPCSAPSTLTGRRPTWPTRRASASASPIRTAARRRRSTRPPKFATPTARSARGRRRPSSTTLR